MRSRDLTGQRFGRWEVIERVADRGTSTKPRRCYLCRCSCPNATERVVFAENLTGGKSQSCGCIAAEINSQNKFVDLSGKRFGRWQVLRRAESSGEHTMFWCICDCKPETEIAVDAASLTRGHSESCGCIRAELHFKHGHAPDGAPTRTYKSWLNMLTRCNNANSPSFYWYGALGVKVCKRWLSFENFLADRGPCPPGLEIDRINPNGNYTPENTRWATQQQQSQNTRARYMHELRGERLTQKVWAQRFGVTLRQLSEWLQRGCTIEQIAAQLNYVPRKPPVSVGAAPLHKRQSS
jgi:hypothetical protein